MELHVVVAALAAACFVAGCGFMPKTPPKPNDTHRVPVNLAAPNLQPSAPTATVPATAAAQIEQVSARTEQVTQAKAPVATNIETHFQVCRIIIRYSVSRDLLSSLQWKYSAIWF